MPKIEYGKLTTEQRNPRSMNIDSMSIIEIVDLINSEDARVIEAVHKEREAIAKAVEIVAQAFRSGGRLIYVGAGTSGRLGVLDASECPPTFGVDPEMVQGIIAGGHRALVRAIEGAEDFEEDGARAVRERRVGPSDVVMGIATSGATPFVHGALCEAKTLGARTIFFTCSEDVMPDADVDVIIRPVVGPEVLTGSTRMKAGTATKLVLNTITTTAMIQIGKVYENLMVDLQVVNRKLQDRAERILMTLTGVERARAKELVTASGGRVKTALVMQKLGVCREEAERRLREADGHVRRASELKE